MECCVDVMAADVLDKPLFDVKPEGDQTFFVSPRADGLDRGNRDEDGAPDACARALESITI
jgi:hypothetical protein